MYGKVEGKTTEDKPNNATTRKGKTKTLMAKRLLEAHKKGEITVTIARGSNLYGPRMQQELYEFSKAFNGESVQARGKLDLLRSFTFTEDFAKAMIILGENESAFGEVWHVPNEEPITQQELINLIFEIAGHEAKVSIMPKLMLATLGRVIPILRELREMQYEWEFPFIVSHEKFANSFDMKPTPYRAAIEKTFDWLKTNK